MKQPTKGSDVNWLARCRISTCHDKRVKCDVCKHYGHVSPHFDERTGQAKESIQHAHFVEEHDGGRNIFCYTKRFAIPKEEDMEVKRRLTAKGRKRIKDKFEERYG